MSDLSYTSSSEPPAGLASTGRNDAIAVGMRRLPFGFLGAALLVTVLHLTVRGLYPEPLVNDSVIRQARLAVKGESPAIVLAGDSRVQLGVDPGRLNQRLALPQGRVINLAVPFGDSTVFTATYHAFAPHFAPRPIVLFGVSLFSVNDRAVEMLSEEFLQTLRFRERLHVVRPTEAVTSEFLPEKSLWQLSMSPVRDLFPNRVARYDPPIPASWNVGKWKPEEAASKLQWVITYWFDRPNIDGLRWRKFSQDMTNLQNEGAQLVVIDSPIHPRMSRALAGTPLEEVNSRFRAKLDDLCAKLGIPVLRYSVADLRAVDVDAVFMDLTHLNEAGAVLLTDRIAGDVARLIAAGKVRLPDSLMPSFRRHNAFASAR